MKNYLIRTIALFIIPLLAIESAGALDVGILELGNGFRCSGTSILNAKGKTVKLGSAKNKIQNKIKGVSGNSAKAKAKRNALKKTKSNLTKCSKGQLTSGDIGGEAPGDNSAVLGKYSGTLTRISINDKNGGCADSATPTWVFSVRVSSTPGEIYVSAGSPFQGGYKGGATASGFKFNLSSLSILKGADTNTLIGSNLTDTSATITITEKHERLVPGKGKGFDRVFSCEATYTGEFSRDKNAL